MIAYETWDGLEEGDGVTVCINHCKFAATIVNIVNPRKIIVQQDIAIVTEGNEQIGTAQYEYKQNPDGITDIFECDDQDQWKMSSSLGNEPYLLKGRYQYIDPTNVDNI